MSYDEDYEQSGGCGEEQYGGVPKAYTKKDGNPGKPRGRPAGFVGRKVTKTVTKATLKDGTPRVISPKAAAGAAKWREEVKAIRDESPTMPYKEALVEASLRRKESDPGYMTTKEKVAAAHPNRVAYGKKNKRPLTMEAAQRILVQYYRDRAGSFKSGNGTRAMRTDISRKSTKKALEACDVDKTTNTMIVTDACKNSWKYRPGLAAGRTGPGIYDIKGLDDGQKGSVVYKKRINKPRATPRATKKATLPKRASTKKTV